MEEPGCFGAINVSTGYTILFVPELSAETAIWMGKLYTLEDFKKRYAVDEVHYTEDIPFVLKEKSKEPRVLRLVSVWSLLLAHSLVAFLSVFISRSAQPGDGMKTIITESNLYSCTT